MGKEDSDTEQTDNGCVRQMEGEHSDRVYGDNTREDEDKGMCCRSVNRYMLPVKVATFIWGARSQFDEYFLMFFVSLGFNAADASILIGFMYIGGFSGGPLWGSIADRYRIHRTLSVVTCIMAALTVCSLPFFGIAFSDKRRFKCPYNTTLQSSVHQQYYTNPTHGSLLFSILFVSCIGMSFDTGLVSLADAGCLQRIKSTPVGKQYYFLVFGMAVGGTMFAGAVAYFPSSNASCDSGIFVVYLAITIVQGIISYYLHKDTEDKNTINVNFMKDLFITLKDYDVLFFLSSVLCSGIMHGVFLNFLYIYLKELKTIPLIYSIHSIVMATSGGIVYYFSEHIVSSLGGTVNAMCCSCFVWVFRYLCVSFINNPYYIIASEMSNGMSYSLFNVASLMYVKEVSSPGIMGAMCGIRYGLYFQLSLVIGSFLGGQLYHTYGGAVLYRMVGIVLCGGWGVVMLSYILAKRLYGGGDYKKLNTEEEIKDDQ